MEKQNMDKVLAQLGDSSAYDRSQQERIQDLMISEGQWTCEWACLKGINQLAKPIGLEEDDDDFDLETKPISVSKAEGFTNMMVWLDYMAMNRELKIECQDLKDVFDAEDEWKANIILNKELELGMKK